MDLSTGMRLYAVTVVAHRPGGTIRVWTAMATASDMTGAQAQQAEAEILAESRRQMPPPFSGHAIVCIADISDTARAFVATYGA